MRRGWCAYAGTKIIHCGQRAKGKGQRLRLFNTPCCARCILCWGYWGSGGCGRAVARAAVAGLRPGAAVLRALRRVPGAGPPRSVGRSVVHSAPVGPASVAAVGRSFTPLRSVGAGSPRRALCARRRRSVGRSSLLGARCSGRCRVRAPPPLFPRLSVPAPVPVPVLLRASLPPLSLPPLCLACSGQPRAPAPPSLRSVLSLPPLLPAAGPPSAPFTPSLPPCGRPAPGTRRNSAQHRSPRPEPRHSRPSHRPATAARAPAPRYRRQADGRSLTAADGCLWTPS